MIKHAQNQQEAVKALREVVRRIFDDENNNIRREQGLMKFESLAEKYLELHAKVIKRIAVEALTQNKR